MLLTDVCFCRLKVCGIPASSKSVGAIFPTAFALQYTVNTIFMCTGKPKNSRDSLCDICFNVVVWNWTHSISKVCLYMFCNRTHHFFFPRLHIYQVFFTPKPSDMFHVQYLVKKIVVFEVSPLQWNVIWEEKELMLNWTALTFKGNHYLI